jgi:uncharacterized protein YdeI (YjbR/CyaY-like superfamily)
MNKNTKQFYPDSKAAWRDWLAENHVTEDGVWLIFYKKKSGIPSLTWSEAVDEALCFGWIDSIKKSIDEQKYKQYFGKRKPSSTWSQINKAKVAELLDAGLMTEAGMKCVDIAKKNGMWTLFDDVEKLIIPEELEEEFRKRPGSKEFFKSLSESLQKGMLGQIVMAKRPETKTKRILEIAESAALGKLPGRYRG